jgi:methionine synthase II (cobalamin-independent)
MLDEFKSEFNQRDIKWQIMGPITFIKSFDNPLTEPQIKKLLIWYQSVILHFYTEHKNSFKKMLLVLDEPLFDIKLKSELLSTLNFFKKTDMDIGVHCCSKLKGSDLIDIKPDYLSIDCSLYNQQELLSIKNIATNLISGVVDTVSGEVCYPISEIIKESKYFTPTCGLAFSEIKICHKALSNLSHL